MRTRIIAILALLATALGTHADDVVTVVTQNGQKSYNMDKLARIELGEDDLVVVGSDEKGTTYAFDKVQKILISLNTTALNDATADSKPTLTLTVSTDGAEMSFNGWDSNIAAWSARRFALRKRTPGRLATVHQQPRHSAQRRGARLL